MTHPAVQGVNVLQQHFLSTSEDMPKRGSPKQRQKRRLKDEKPVIEAVLAWADSQPVTGNGRLSKAITSIRNRRKFMLTFLEDGRCSLSNNPGENSIRPVTVGRKNWLFSSSVLLFQTHPQSRRLLFSRV